jgi:hypothetical protein
MMISNIRITSHKYAYINPNISSSMLKKKNGINIIIERRTKAISEFHKS